MPGSSNRDWIGVAQPEFTFRLDRERIAAFAKATDDANPRYFGHSPLAPPLSVVLGTVPGAFQPFFESRAFMGELQRASLLVHIEEDIRWLGLMPADDALRMQVTLLSIDDRSIGEFLTFETRVGGRDGASIATVTSTMVIRDPKPFTDRISRTRNPAREPVLCSPPTGPSHAVDWRVADDQAVRYADASGDRNAIHLDPEAAKRLGLRAPVLHGLCTMALAQRVTVDYACGGEPERLKRLRVRFSRPVYMGDTLTCVLQPVAVPGHYRIQVHNQQGVAVLKDSFAEVES